MKNVTVILLITLVLAAPCAWAQTLNPGQDPSVEAERFKDQAERQKGALEEVPIEAPETEIIPQTKPLTANVSFVLTRVTITGSTVFKPEDFRDVYEPFLAKTVGFDDLQAIFKGIEAKYVKKGFLTSTAYLPQQDIVDGKIEIRVAEGAMGKLKIEGNKYFSKAYIQKRFHTQEGQILNISSLERDILRLNQSSDLAVKTVISPGKDLGTSDITLQVKDKFPWHVGYGLDNQGTRLTGKWRNSFTQRSTNVTGRGDTLYHSTIVSNGSLGDAISYTVPLTTKGTKFGYDFTYFKMHLGKEFRRNHIRGRTMIHTPKISWELALKQDFQATATAGIDIKSNIKTSNKVKISDDQLRIPWAKLDIAKTDPMGRTTFTPRISMGTAGFLGATKRHSLMAARSGTGGGSFYKYDHILRRTQKMPWASYLDLRSQLQLASRSLPSSEQLQIGGAYSVRGYPEGNYLADSGFVLNTEWYFPMYLIPKEWVIKGQKIPLRHQIEPFLFADVGGGKLKRVVLGEKTDTQFLSSLGGGVQFSFSRLFSLKLQWAKAVGGHRPVSGSGPSTFYFSLQSEY
jgi:hemolysin activation/secretion protein